MEPPGNIRVAAAVTGNTPLDGLFQTMKAEGWELTVVDNVAALPALAESGQYHATIIASNAPQDLPPEAVRELLGLVLDLVVVFLVPANCDTADCPAMLGVTSDQIWRLDTPPAELVETIRQEAASAASNRPEYTVVCVDDDREFLASLGWLLAPGTGKVSGLFAVDFEFFTDPAEALDGVQSLDRPLAVAICDQVMPGMQGMDLLSEIKQVSPSTRRVLLTGYAGLDLAVRAVNERLLDKYLTKPVERPEDFVAVVRGLVNEYHLHSRAISQRHRMMAQFEFIHAIAGADSRETVLRNTANFLFRQLRVPWTAVVLVEEGKTVLRAKGGSPPQLPEAACKALAEALGANGHRQRLPDVLDEQALPVQIGEADAPATKIMAAPLLARDDLLGVILVGLGGADQPPTRDDRLLLAFVADIAALTIGRFRDHDTLENYYVGTMASLMDVVEAKDKYTRGHTDRVLQLALTLAEAIGVGADLLKDIRYAAALHDIGKLSVPEGILRKPGRLLPGEQAIVREHPARAETILRHLHFLDSARLIIRSHHERYDGKGYPHGLAGEEIPLGARILAIADAYDAMTSTRPYRRAMQPEQALAEIQAGAGTQFDPRLAELFVNLMRDEAAREHGEPHGASSKPVEAQRP